MATKEAGDVTAMSQRERDRLRVLRSVEEGKCTQAKAAELLSLTTRQVHRLLKRWRKEGDGALAHGLRGKTSNRRADGKFKKKVLRAYRARYGDFGPTFASEKLATEGLSVPARTLRDWLTAEGLIQRRRRGEQHRSRRPRRSCFGELVQMDTSIHDWTEGRGETMVLITMIDDATSRVLARFYPGDTVEAHFDLLGRWLRKHGRPLALYTDRHSIFEAHKKGDVDYEGETQFGRALGELDVALILAGSPQAKGRVERSFRTAQDRWVKDLRLAKVKAIDSANALLDEGLLDDHNARFSVPAVDPMDAHRRLGKEHLLEAILSIQAKRVVNNDYTIRYRNRLYQIAPPPYPGLRRGTVIMEQRADGTLAVRFKSRYLNCRDADLTKRSSGKTNKDRASGEETRSPGMKPTSGRSGRTSAEPYPPAGEGKSREKAPYRPGPDHPWRKGFRQRE